MKMGKAAPLRSASATWLCEKKKGSSSGGGRTAQVLRLFERPSFRAETFFPKLLSLGKRKLSSSKKTKSRRKRARKKKEKQEKKKRSKDQKRTGNATIF
jgi:hypothetical protein